MVIVEAAFSLTLAGEKAWATVGGFGFATVSVAELTAALPPPGPVMRTCAAMELVYVPRAPLETLTITVQLPCAAISVPLRLMVVEVVLKEAPVPVHVVVAAGEAAIVIPAGSVSLKLIWLSVK